VGAAIKNSLQLYFSRKKLTFLLLFLSLRGQQVYEELPKISANFFFQKIQTIIKYHKSKTDYSEPIGPC
jgi:hypothetical protein